MDGLRNLFRTAAGWLLFFLLVSANCDKSAKKGAAYPAQAVIKLPPPILKSATSIEEALSKRRSARNYAKEPLSLQEIAQLLWAGQGITSESGGRTAPSAGAIYPLQLYLVSGEVEGLPPGVYQYLPEDHAIRQSLSGDLRDPLSAAALSQGSVRRGAAVIVITGNYERITRKYKERGIRFTWMEAGHVAQNICLQSVSLEIGTVTVGAFRDSLVKQLLRLPAGEEPLYLMPVGKKEE